MPQQELDAFLGRLTLVNGAMACVAGVVSDVVVSRYETFKAPFVASAICLVLAFFAISCTWVENYGEARCTDGKHEQQRRWTHLAEGLKVIWRGEFLGCASESPSLISMACRLFSAVSQRRDYSLRGFNVPYGLSVSSAWLSTALRPPADLALLAAGLRRSSTHYLKDQTPCLSA